MRDERRFGDMDDPLGFAFMLDQDMNAMTNYCDLTELQQFRQLCRAREAQRRPGLEAFLEKQTETDLFRPPRRRPGS